MTKSRGVNRMVWFEKYIGDPETTAIRNVWTLEKIVGKWKAWVDQTDVPGEVMLGMETADEGKFRKAVEAVIFMRGEVLRDVYEFVFKGKKRTADWDTVERLAG